jgi:hypothetical protein
MNIEHSMFDVRVFDVQSIHYSGQTLSAKTLIVWRARIDMSL